MFKKFPHFFFRASSHAAAGAEAYSDVFSLILVPVAPPVCTLQRTRSPTPQASRFLLLSSSSCMYRPFGLDHTERHTRLERSVIPETHAPQRHVPAVARARVVAHRPFASRLTLYCSLFFHQLFSFLVCRASVFCSVLVVFGVGVGWEVSHAHASAFRRFSFSHSSRRCHHPHPRWSLVRFCSC